MLKITSPICLIPVLVLIVSVIGIPSSAYMFQGDPTHSGIFDAGQYPPMNTEVWNVSLGPGDATSPVYADGVLYAGSSTGIHALSPEDGHQIWKYTTGSPVRSIPAVNGGVVYAGCDNNKIYAINAFDGMEKWNFTTGNSVINYPTISSSPVVIEDTVYVGAKDKKFYALWTANGTIRWSYTCPDVIYSSPAYSNRKIIFGTWNSFYALSADSGNMIWSYPTGGSPMYGSALVHNGTVYFGSHDRYIHALDLESGVLKWRSNYGLNSVMNTPIIINGILYVVDSTSTIFSWYANNGTYIGAKYWSTYGSGDYYCSSSPVSAGKTLYIPTPTGLLAVTTKDASKLWFYPSSQPLIRQSPSISDGKIFFGEINTGIIHALTSSDPVITSITPQVVLKNNIISTVIPSITMSGENIYGNPQIEFVKEGQESVTLTGIYSDGNVTLTNINITNMISGAWDIKIKDPYSGKIGLKTNGLIIQSPPEENYIPVRKYGSGLNTVEEYFTGPYSIATLPDGSFFICQGSGTKYIKHIAYTVSPKGYELSIGN